MGSDWICQGFCQLKAKFNMTAPLKQAQVIQPEHQIPNKKAETRKCKSTDGHGREFKIQCPLSLLPVSSFVKTFWEIYISIVLLKSLIKFGISVTLVQQQKNFQTLNVRHIFRDRDMTEQQPTCFTLHFCYFVDATMSRFYCVYFYSE